MVMYLSMHLLVHMMLTNCLVFQYATMYHVRPTTILHRRSYHELFSRKPSSWNEIVSIIGGDQSAITSSFFNGDAELEEEDNHPEVTVDKVDWQDPGQIEQHLAILSQDVDGVDINAIAPLLGISENGIVRLTNLTLSSSQQSKMIINNEGVMNDGTMVDKDNSVSVITDSVIITLPVMLLYISLQYTKLRRFYRMRWCR